MESAKKYEASLAQSIKLFGNLLAILDKFQAFAETKKFEPANVLTARLAPDQFHLIRQIQIMSDTAKLGFARLAAKEAPAFEDKEQTLDEVRTRISKTVTYLQTLKAGDFAGADERKITLPRHDGKYLLGSEYLREFVTPNFYFHFTTAYAILRHNGLEIGKKDFLGSVPFKNL